jgi:hypothetical protein
MDDFKDPLVEEIHETRMELLQRYGGSEGYAQHLRDMESQVPELLVTREPRSPVKTRRHAS